MTSSSSGEEYVVLGIDGIDSYHGTQEKALLRLQYMCEVYGTNPNFWVARIVCRGHTPIPTPGKSTKREYEHATASYFCNWCGREFTAKLADRARGWAKCCNKTCAAKFRQARQKFDRQMRSSHSPASVGGSLEIAEIKDPGDI